MPFTFRDTPCGDIVCSCDTASLFNANVINSILMWVTMTTFFIIATADGCEKCYACVEGQDTCTDVPGMTLEYAVAISTANRLYGLYLMCTGAWFWMYISPVLESSYPPALLHLLTRLLVVVACFIYYINPPHIQAQHNMCSTDAGARVFIDSVPVAGTNLFQQNTCIFTSPIDQYEKDAGQEFSVIFYWVVFLLVTAIINCQMLTLIFMNWSEGGQGVRILVAIGRVVIWIVMFTMIVLAGATAGQTNQERGSSIFYYELSGHMMLLLYLATLFYEVAKEKLDKDLQEANQTTENLQDGQAHRSHIQLQNITEHKSPIHSQMTMGDDDSDILQTNMGALSSAATPMPVGI